MFQMYKCTHERISERLFPVPVMCLLFHFRSWREGKSVGMDMHTYGSAFYSHKMGSSRNSSNFS